MKKSAKLTAFLLVLAVAAFSAAACGQTQVETTYKSAYEIAVENGYTGSETEWLESLKGQSAYEIAVENGFTGTEQEWLESLKSDSTKSAYEIDKENGFTGTYEEWLYNNYQDAVENGHYSGTYQEWLSETKGEQGEKGENGDTSVLYAANKSVLSVVSIVGSYRNSTVSGSGVLYDDNSGNSDKEDGNAYIITNYHVVENIKQSYTYYAYLYGQEYSDYKIPVTYVGGSASYDIAVLKISDSDIYKNGASFALTKDDIIDSDDTTIGQTALAVGNAEGEGISVTSGIISVKSENITIDTTSYRVMRVDAAVNPGNSGGGLFNKDANLIGIVNAKSTDSDVDSIGYAIPTNIAVGAADNIIRNEDGTSSSTVKKAFLGIMVEVESSTVTYDETENIAYISQQIGIQSIDSTTSAAYGILEVGDILISYTYNGATKDVTQLYTLSDAAFYFTADSSVDIKIKRNGNEQTVTITFDSGDIQSKS